MFVFISSLYLSVKNLERNASYVRGSLFLEKKKRYGRVCDIAGEYVDDFAIPINMERDS